MTPDNATPLSITSSSTQAVSGRTAAVIYCMFAFWLFAIVLAARGTLKLWVGMVPPKIVAWALLILLTGRMDIAVPPVLKSP